MDAEARGRGYGIEGPTLSPLPCEELPNARIIFLFTSTARYKDEQGCNHSQEGPESFLSSSSSSHSTSSLLRTSSEFSAISHIARN